MNTTEFLTIASAIVPERPAFIFDDLWFSFADLQGRVNRLASSLAQQGVGPGDRVATMQVNSNQSIEIYFAAAQLDAVYVPLNFRAKSEELDQMLNIAQPSMLFIGERYLPRVAAGIENGILSSRRVVLLDGPAAKGHQAYDDVLQSGEAEQMHFPEAEDQDTTVIMFTAGTTGLPKGVMLTHDSFSSFLLTNVSPADPDLKETNLLTVPFYHIAGLQAALAAVYGGRTVVVMRQFEPLEWLTLAHRHQANRAMLVPTMLKQLMDHPQFDEFDLSSLDVITYGAAPMPLPVIQQAIKQFPTARFINAFGQTETASTITMLPPEDHDLQGSPEEVEKKLRRLSSIGKPLDDVIVRVVDEDGEDMPEGEVGEIVASGSRLMKGYWHREEETKETIRNGWLFTGDLGYFDEDGYIFLSGRAKDFIKRGGEMISPDEIEGILVSHPAVDEAAIIGIPDDYWGERVRAIVVIKQGHTVTPEELVTHCHERLASYKRPESVVFTDLLPRNQMGKVIKRELREQFNQPFES